MLIFLAKVQNAVELNEFRGIALLRYMACIMVLLRECTRQRMGRSWTRHLVFGFEEGHNTEQIVAGLTLLVQRGVEWHHVRPVSILSADVKAAFDELSIDTIINSLMYWEFPPDLVAALVEETMELTATASVQDVRASGEFSFNRFAKQGGIESPWE